ncbi:DNA-binding domain-containing protein [Asticcacaulis sp. ZE23SCel15]|uniref:HvfC/BufC N-terminal domain-containing protein n=1 Tax=Asticcacaulis sp. ZE23SCel15 TaxID=3059027 RepID=UPI00265E1807|nr:DNA-binding domain-containing protein [Asticcacaulis sp. ZE23SCel15]WKL58934.1 DNA-binding domain-containing protein [Asticcacaulis sp. ZE23SCel15]
MTYRHQLEQLYEAATGRGAADMHLFKAARGNILPPQRRLNIYANGYYERLKAAVAADYPALAAFMGAGAFNAVVDVYVAATPSRHWDLNLYPIGLPDLVSPGPARNLATLEAAIVAVFWTADSTPLTAADLTGVDEAAFAEMPFELRTASRLFRFETSPNTYLTAHRAGNPALIGEGPEYLLIVRHGHEVHRHALEPLEYDVLTRLSKGQSLTESITTEAAAERLPHWLGRWLTDGFFNKP